MNIEYRITNKLSTRNAVERGRRLDEMMSSLERQWLINTDKHPLEQQPPVIQELR